MDYLKYEVIDEYGKSVGKYDSLAEAFEIRRQTGGNVIYRGPKEPPKAPATVRDCSEHDTQELLDQVILGDLICQECCEHEGVQHEDECEECGSTVDRRGWRLD